MIIFKNKLNKKGFVLGTVFLFITFFFIVGSAVLFSARQEQPVLDKIDNLSRARYVAQGFMNVIELKMKVLDAEFMEALLDDEKTRTATDPKNLSESKLFNEFFYDFKDDKRIMTMGVKTSPFRVLLHSVEREHLQYTDNSTSTSNELYYTEILKITVAVSWQDKTQGNKVITDYISKTFRFKRRYKS